ncbi:MAG: hypothetical protein KF841_07600 [Phycisphaerae bacterium]|nr:hypothetical protein [Phycisphaerae bacterium]
MNTALVAILVCLGCEGVERAVPESLSKAVSRRMAFKTAYFEYSYEAHNPGIWLTPKHGYAAGFAGREVYWTDFGDADGIVIRDPLSGRPTFGVAHACAPARFVRCNEGKDEWSIRDGAAMANAYPTPKRLRLGGRATDRFLDPRSCGLDLLACSETSPDDWLQDLQGRDYDWSEKIADGMIEVTSASRKHAGSRSSLLVWRIDPSKDYAVVEIRRYRVQPNGSREVVARMEARHENVNGRWWPMECVTTFAKGGGETFTFTRVEFDRKDHPEKLSPDILGIPPGLTVVDRINWNSDLGPLKTGRYIGNGRVVSVQEWNETYSEKIGTAALDAFLSKAQAIGTRAYPAWWNARGDTLGLENVQWKPDLWEAYVRRWIIRHSYDTVGIDGIQPARLSDSQVETAWAILKDCRKRAEPIVRRRSEEDSAGAAGSAGIEQGSPNAAQSGNTATLKERQSTSQETVNDAGPYGPSGSDNAGPVASQPLGRYDRELGGIFELLKTRLYGLLTTTQQKNDPQNTRGPKAGE